MAIIIIALYEVTDDVNELPNQEKTAHIKKFHMYLKQSLIRVCFALTNKYLFEQQNAKSTDII